jgi:hypothetical protein
VYEGGDYNVYTVDEKSVLEGEPVPAAESGIRGGR